MATAENVFNLAEQLQHFETSLTNIMFEVSLKLSSLTNSRVFLLVDNGVCRKLAGDSNLCQAYSTVGLKSAGNDFRVELEQPFNGLKQSASPSCLPPPPPTSMHFAYDTPNDVGAALAESGASIAHKRSHENIRDAPPTIPKRQRLSLSSLNVDFHPSNPDPIVDGRGGEDDDVIIEENETKMESLQIRPFFDADLMERSFDQTVKNHHGDLAVTIASDDVNAYLLENSKVAAFRQMSLDVNDSELDVASPVFKIMTSVLYDVSKTAALTAPARDKRHPNARAHFEATFERILLEFPHIQTLNDRGIKVKGMRLRNFVRNTMQKTYGKLLDKSLANRLVETNLLETIS